MNMIDCAKTRGLRIFLLVAVVNICLSCTSGEQEAVGRAADLDQLFGTEFVSQSDLPEAPVEASTVTVTISDRRPSGGAEAELRTDPGCNSFELELDSGQGRTALSGEPSRTLAACAGREREEMDEWLMNRVLKRSPHFVIVEDSEIALAFENGVIELSVAR